MAQRTSVDNGKLGKNSANSNEEGGEKKYETVVHVQDKFFARLARDKDGHNIISIYEAPEMRLHNNTSITMDGVQVRGQHRGHRV